jgi:hypothetical protein
MSNLYFIVMEHSVGDFVLTRTAAKSPKQAWDRAVEVYGNACLANSRAGIIKELKKREGWHLVKIAVPFKVS